MAHKKMNVDGQAVRLKEVKEEKYISLTDMLKGKKKGATGQIIGNWLRSIDTLEFLKEWEMHNNPRFNVLEFEYIRKEAGGRSYYISLSEWIDRTNATGIISKPGRYGGTYAHPDIAFDFGAWISPRFRYLLYREYQRLEKAEMIQLDERWQQSRLLSKIYLTLQTEAVKRVIVPRIGRNKNPYASEADVINRALFGQTAREWREANPELANKGNVRDFATERENATLAAIEAINSYLIMQGANQYAREEALTRMSLFILEVLNLEDRLKLLDS